MSRHGPEFDPARLSGKGRRFAIVGARFNATVVDRLVEGAHKTLFEHGAEAVEVFRVPGALELSGVVRRLADSGRYAGIVGLGVVIRGDTIHFDLVAEQAVAGLARIADEGRVAIGNCVLACEDLAQAEARAGGHLGNRGADAARVVLEVAALYAALGPGAGTMIRGTRRKARDVVLQILYQLDADPALSPEAAVELYFRELVDPGEGDEKTPGALLRAEDFDRPWITARVAGVAAAREALDARLSDASRSWRVDRMSRLDRNILRLALYELGLPDEVPRKVVFNEAIELAKRFGSAEAPAFINGVLESAAPGGN